MTIYTGTRNNDHIDGDTDLGAPNDVFKMKQRGLDFVDGKTESDVFYFGKFFNGFNKRKPFKHDTVVGGDDFDTLVLKGKYVHHHKLVFNDQVIQSLETITLSKGGHAHPNAYDLTFKGSFDVGPAIDGGALSADDSMVVDLSHTSQTMVVDVGLATAQVTAQEGQLFASLDGHALIAFTGGGQNDFFSWYGAPVDLRVPLGGVHAHPSLFNVHSVFDGRAGHDELFLSGDMSSGVVFLPTTIQSIEKIRLDGGFGSDFSYDITTDDANVAAGKRLTVDGGAVAAADTVFNFDGSAETDGSFTIIGGFRGGIYKTGGGNDIIGVGPGGNTIAPGSGTDTVNGDSGTDIVKMGAFLDATDQISGGGGINDEIDFNGDYSALVAFGPTTVVDFDIMRFAPDHAYNFKFDDANILNGKTLTIEATDLGHDDSVRIDGSTETNGVFEFHGGDGEDVFKGGAGTASSGTNAGFGDQIHGNGGADNIFVGTGTVEHDLYYAGTDSYGLTHHDTIHQFDGTRDGLDVGPSSPGVTQVNSGTLSKGSFDADLAAAMGSSNAIAFHPDAGNLAGHYYLVINSDGVSGYQNGDLVIEFVDPVHWGSFTFFHVGG